MDPYRQTAEAVLTGLDADARSGLSRSEAEKRLARYGRNELTEKNPIPRWRKFLAQFPDALVVLLIIAALVSAGLRLYERNGVLPYDTADPKF
jgi:Ca2+-transporting ATPase